MAQQDERDRRWAAIYAHRERLLRVSRARLGNAQDAEDCVQEAMLRCIEFADLDEARLGQFLTSVTVRLCADVHRGRARRDRLHLRLTSFVTIEAGPEDTVCDRAETDWLTRQLDTLSPRQRAIVEARAEGLSFGAVAERAALSYTAVESAMARIRRSMRGALESTYGALAAPRAWLTARRLLVGAATATAAVVTIGHLPGEFDRPNPPRVVALPPGGGVAAGGPAGTAAAGATAPASQSAAAVPRAAVRKRVIVEVTGRVRDPDSTEIRTPAGRATVGPSHETLDQFVTRCLTYGVEPRGSVLDCGHDHKKEGLLP